MADKPSVVNNVLASYEESHAKYREVSVTNEEGSGPVRERINCECEACVKVREILSGDK